MTNEQIEQLSNALRNALDRFVKANSPSDGAILAGITSFTVDVALAASAAAIVSGGDPQTYARISVTILEATYQALLNGADAVPMLVDAMAKAVAEKNKLN